MGEESTPATTAPPTFKPTTFSPELLEEQIKLLMMNLAYDEKAAQSVASEMVGWSDKEGNPFLGTRKGELIDTKERYKEGEITIDGLTEAEVRIARELSWKIKEEIPEYRVENWHLDDAIKDKGANCVGYTQLLYVLGKTVGLSVEPIEVLGASDIKEGHVTGLIGLSDERKVMVELTSTPAFTTQAFKLEEEYKTMGNYLELLDDDSMIPHTRIRRLDKDGLMASVFISRGKNYDSSGEYLRTIAEINVAVELDPKYALAYNNRGIAYHRLGYLYDALADLDVAIELDPEFAEAYSNRGVIRVASGNYTSAISDYDKAIELDPGYAKAYYRRGDTYNYLEDYDSAMSDYNKAIELNPELAEAYGNRGTVYSALGEHSKAMSDYTSAIELNPNSSVTYYNRGNAHYNLKEYSKAISDYTSAIESNPELAEAYNNRGNAYSKLGESQKAQKDFDTAARLDPRFKR